LLKQKKTTGSGAEEVFFDRHHFVQDDKQLQRSTADFI